ncbi:molecular chaperone HtpG [Actinokineospora pegani]|uniref:molecular chaperone HtpG n=1 Tax=Actinokineospora pegani TaxID=2654637 RepID=UPI0012E9F71C|nr:molecular chaperone HtpG [Actinokineospora pegani]
MTTQVETFEFQAEVRQLLQLMIHSIYSNKDAFLRELVSNASDALDKLKLEAFKDKDLSVDTSDLHVEVEVDAEARTLTVRDNGIGMTRDDVVRLIGTIAKSGTAEFLKMVRESQDAAGAQDLIGQFGVGFYASFMVADRVTLVTRYAGEETGTRWESGGEGTYTIEPVEDAPQGTAVTLHLKAADADEQMPDYTAQWKLREIVKRYSDFITHPIRMAVEKPGAEGEEPTTEVQTLNSMKALWARSASEVSDTEYADFYRHIANDWAEPLKTVQMSAEGTFEYQALLFIPSHAPLDLFMRDANRGIHLYVKRVFIMDDCESLIPEYLRFVKGVVDAADLSLNVSRETLQQDRQIQLIRRRLVKKILTTVKELRGSDADKYKTFWSEFGRAVKEGLVQDPDNRDAILEVCSFESTLDAEQQTSLRGYVERMKDGQQHIYYMTGDSRAVVENSPHMEALKAKGYEVLVLTDPIDEMWVDAVPEYDGKQFQSIAKGQVDLGGDDAAKDEEQEKEFADFLTWMSDSLKDSVKQVRLSTRLTTSPACVVGDSDDLAPNLEKMYRAMGHELPQVKRILELNPAHGLVSGLRAAHQADPEDPALAETASLVHDMAVLAEGGELADSARFIRLLSSRLEKSL